MKLIDQYEDIELVDALEERYLAYALTTIMDRALPDSRDGLKPVHRRLLYAMYQLNLKPSSSFKKSARVVGDVMGRFHPHGDQAIYDTLVRLAQDFSVRWPLIDGQGNFGNIDGDNAAAMRYTEARLTDVSQLLLNGIEENAVEFRSTYDEVDKEPIVLPANFPNLLANGSSGIAVGMATSIPPHNIEELCNASLHLIKHRNASYEKLLEFIPGPDFPTGGEIFEIKENIIETYKTGRGGFKIRSKWSVEQEKRGLWKIVVTEIPYQVSKGKLIEKIAQLAIDKKLPMLDDIRDESAEDIRLVLIPKNKDINPEGLMDSLFLMSDLEARFSVNLNALSNNIPIVHGLRDLLLSWLDHRKEVLLNISNFRLDKIEERLEILSGLLIAYLNMDEIIKIIREEDNPKTELIARFELSDFQAESILNMRLRSLRKLEEIKIKNEFDELTFEKRELVSLLNSNEEQWKFISNEIKDLKKQYSKSSLLGERRTSINLIEEEIVYKNDYTPPSEPVSIILSSEGWIRCLKGSFEDLGEIKFKEEDSLFLSIDANTNDKLVIFCSNGKSYSLNVSDLPSGRGHGAPLKILFDIEEEHSVINIFTYEKDKKIILSSSLGNGFIIKHQDMLSSRKSGKAILNIKEGERASFCKHVDGSHIAIIGENKKMLIFSLDELPEMSKGKGVRLQKYKDSEVLFIKTFNPKEGLIIEDSGGRKRVYSDTNDWIGKRAQSGRLVPKGFPRLD
ncbi:MAG: DNA topoisomerase IV subunit A [Hyphomicrobiales bacterium]|jgi:topoisomerase-4 subunit A|nr:DNA topoisomerase IV subunit A [Hyphomicrobiales bacterium]MDG1665301.1 DNA topoisomerase IV subunit A [Hyphomicrobiales bacterium]MDG2413157.1 DNA topoisomerase IV subunit A [Hyphomicrobiales bacterium]|tara:strand:+ start:2492 stop:4696 length:2205 start_codon:yes stop_codon:yes gene_type:complete